LGAGAFTRHVKRADEDPWWPTALPLDDDQRPHSDRPRDVNGVILEPGKNIAQTIIDEAHTRGLRIIAYYWDASEATLAQQHHDWICLNPHGNAFRTRRGTNLDLTGPYREVVRVRLLELAAMGADGFLFDNFHLPLIGCWGTALEEAWKTETGEDAAPRPHDEGRRYRRFLDFKARKIEETFAYWRHEVKAQYPEVVFVISTDMFAALMDRAVTTRLARIADSAKNEYCQALRRSVNKGVFKKHCRVLAEPPDHVRQSLGWMVLRDSSEGRPPLIWHPGVPSAAQAEAYAASLLTFGAIASMDTYEADLDRPTDQPGKTPVEGLERAFALGKVVSPHLAGTQPLRWAALHFSERSRNQRGADYLVMWQQVLWPLLGPYKTLSEDGLPVGIVNDDQLTHGELQGYRLLILPNPRELTASQARAVATFTASGGTVIENNRAWAWANPARTDAAAAAFRNALRPHVTTAPVWVKGGPSGRYAVSYRKPGQLIIAVTNDFSWVQFSALYKPVPDRDINHPPPRAHGIQIAWRTRHVPPQPPSPSPRLLPPRAVEAISNKPLTAHPLPGGYEVQLPDFKCMALVVVTQRQPV
jgi:hypothetical protein